MTPRPWVKRSDDLIAPFVSASIIVAWIFHLVFTLRSDLSLPALIFHILLQTFLSTGLFITTHDSIHGIAAPKNRLLNARFGQIAAFLYGGFSYSKLSQAHWLHHDHPVSSEDPDYTSDQEERFFHWLFEFGKRYYGWREFLLMHVHVAMVLIISGGSVFKLFAFFAVPAWLSALQLFYFGTYLPHRTKRGSAHVDACNARSNDLPIWLSLLTCYHFGYHHEHHRFPSAQWWVLPRIKAAAKTNQK